MDELQFKYFLGPPDHMAGILETPTTCDLCHATNRRCFKLSRARVTATRSTEPKSGCANCLRAGKFYFTHNTEAGITDGARLRREYNSHRRIDVAPQRVIELIRTPEFTSWQESPWLIHCDDFMAYLGEWKPADFRKQSKDGDGRALFIEMTDEAKKALLWDAADKQWKAEGVEEFDSWYAAYYAFRCLHCGKLRGTWDCP